MSLFAARSVRAAEAAEAPGSFEPRPARFELGFGLGVMAPSQDHNLRGDAARHESYAVLGPELALRAGFLPIEYAGVEVEGAWLPTSTESDGSASLFAGRFHALGQLPLGPVTPFALFGGGALGGGSSTMGTDTDPALHFGLGTKYPLSESFAVRLDLRDTLSQRFGGAQGALTHHLQAMLSATLALELRRRPEPPPNPPADSDGDGLLDARDRCPGEAGTLPSGCPERDGDGDGVFDSKDLCPGEAGTPDRCGCGVKDTDRDGIPDEFDRCPLDAGPLHGCPATDPDRERNPLPDDRCPECPENENGLEDGAASPDEVP